MRERHVTVMDVSFDRVTFTFAGHEYRAPIRGRHTCPGARPIREGDRLTIAHRGRTGDVLVVATCGCPFLIFDVIRPEKGLDRC
jgi:hypothetical protein